MKLVETRLLLGYSNHRYEFSATFNWPIMVSCHFYSIVLWITMWPSHLMMSTVFWEIWCWTVKSDCLQNSLHILGSFRHPVIDQPTDWCTLLVPWVQKIVSISETAQVQFITEFITNIPLLFCLKKILINVISPFF